MIDTTNLEVQNKIAKYLKKERLDYVNSNIDKFEFNETFYTKYIKRLLDVIISLPIFILTLPINLILAFCTIIFLGFPLFYSQYRVGKDGKYFKLVKFRNLTNEKDEMGNLLPAKDRLTRFGSIVRKTSLDELLNFWNILKGDMSLIGPRALPPVYYNRYNEKHILRLKVKPGLECPPRKLLDHERTWHEQFENDCWYVQNISFKTDVLMVFKLVAFALNKKNAKMRAQCQKGSFIGYSWDGKAISNYDLKEKELRIISKKIAL